MDLISILSTVILLVTIGTIAVALAAYGAVKVRDKRKPGGDQPVDIRLNGGFQPEFLTRYCPPDTAKQGIRSQSVPAPIALKR